MTAIHEVLRYVLARVPHSTQDDHDRIAAVIDEDDDGAQITPDEQEQTTPDEPDEDGAQTTPARSRGGRKS